MDISLRRRPTPTKEELVRQFDQYKTGETARENIVQYQNVYVEYCKQPIIRIGAWNIHGVNTSDEKKQTKKIEHIVKQDLDFVALTETWHGKLNLPGYEQIDYRTTKSAISPRKEKNRDKKIAVQHEPRNVDDPKHPSTHTGGIRFYYKLDIRDIFYKSNCMIAKIDNDCENVLIIKITRDRIRSNKDLYIFIVYWYPQLTDDQICERVNHIKAKLNEYNTIGNTILVGDFNARTQEQSHDSLQCPRLSCDRGKNTRGTILLEMCRDSGHIILNGRCPGDLLGCLTFHGSNGGVSTNDYIICNEALFPLVEYMYVHEKGLSDHCLLEVCFRLPSSAIQAEDVQNALTGPESKLKLGATHHINPCAVHGVQATDEKQRKKK